MPTGIYIRKPCSEEARKNMSLARIGKHLSEETKKKLSLINTGKVGFYRGKKRPPFSEEWKRNISLGHRHLPPLYKGKRLPEEWKKNISLGQMGRVSGMKGKHHPQEWKDKMSEFMKGNKYSLGYRHTEEAKAKIGLASKNQKWSEERRKKQSLLMKGKKLSAERIKKCLTRHIPSSLEVAFQKVIDAYNLPYRYTGNGSFILNGMNPDFINTNNEKIAIEVYARYYKQRNEMNIEKWENERRKKFEELGWKVIFLNEMEVAKFSRDICKTKERELRNLFF